MDADQARRELLQLIQSGPTPFPYDRAALLIAVDEYPRVELGRYEARLDALAGAVAAGVAKSSPDAPRARLGALRRVLFEEGGFHGNRAEYYDTRNSYLNEVLDRKLGIPISLAVVCLGVARRLGWPLAPVNFPNHFLLRYEAPGELLAVDAFNGGLILGPEDLTDLWRSAVGTDPPTESTMLPPACPREVVIRMLNNIWLVHRHHRRFARAALAVEKLMLLSPEEAGFERELGQLRIQGSDLPAGLGHLERYLARSPHGADAEVVRLQIDWVRKMLEPTGSAAAPRHSTRWRTHGSVRPDGTVSPPAQEEPPCTGQIGRVG
jgi:regulator of sirC expression with transglutaminase-like and TPR domain